MDLGLKGKKVLITGGSKGIGAVVRPRLCGRRRQHHPRLANGRSAEEDGRRDPLAPSGQVETHAADLSQGPAREATMQRFPDIDILVNNAGAIPGGSIVDLTMERWIESWQLKVFGYIHMTKLALDRDEAAQERHHRQHHRHGRPSPALGLCRGLDRQRRPQRLHQGDRLALGRLRRARVRHQSRLRP